MKPLTLEETGLKEEIKGQYYEKEKQGDKDAGAKFDVLCRLEDFEVQYWELKKLNKGLEERVAYLERSIDRKEEMIRDLRTETITIDYELRNILISALRYAIGRKTYIAEEVCSYIKEHPELIDERVKIVMLRDLKDIDIYYKKTDIDYIVFDYLKQWLENLNTEKFAK